MFMKFHFRFMNSVIVFGMDTLIHADVFFFISSISVIVIAIVVVVVGVYVVTVLRDAKYISKKLRNAADELEEDFENLRKEVTGEGRKAKYLIDFFLGKFLGKKRQK